MDQALARERDDLRRVDRTRFEELVRERSVEARRSIAEVEGREERRAHQRVAVRVQAGGREPDDDIVLIHPVRAEERRLVHDSHAEPREIEGVLRHHSGMLGGLAAEERAPRPATAFGDALNDRDDTRGLHSADGQIVEEEQRLRAGARHVVGAHRHEVDPDGVQPIGLPRDLELRPHAVGGRGEEPAFADAIEPGEAAHLIGDLRAPHARGEIGDQGDRLGRGLGVDTRLAVGGAHAVGSRS